MPVALKRTIAALLFTKDRFFEVEHVKIQKQVGGNDCGLFAIANAHALCTGKDPACIRWDQRNMRTHFAECMHTQCIQFFPCSQVKRAASGGINRTSVVEVFCFCRQPEGLDDRMVQCQQCKEWYHETCHAVPSNLFSDKSAMFCCLKCT